MCVNVVFSPEVRYQGGLALLEWFPAFYFRMSHEVVTNYVIQNLLFLPKHNQKWPIQTIGYIWLLL